MGYLKDRHGLTLPDEVPPGVCPMCAGTHEPHEPHDQQSLAYQYKFYDLHGRWPTWADAMAHCPDGLKASWAEALKSLGISVDEQSETATMTVEITPE